MNTLKSQVEAVLFLTGRPLTLKEVADVLNAAYEAVEDAMGDLLREYGFREDCALEIDDSDGYILQVKPELMTVVNRMMPMEISAGALRTLSAIAVKSPILQSELIDWRGPSAYDHMPELLEKKLISKTRQGRSYLLRTTPTFHAYFKLTGDKAELQALLPRA
jgi:segregation and condensation protein B